MVEYNRKMSRASTVFARYLERAQMAKENQCVTEMKNHAKDQYLSLERLLHNSVD